MKILNLGKVKLFGSPMTKIGERVKKMKEVQVVVFDNERAVVLHSDCIERCEIGEDLKIKVEDYLVVTEEMTYTDIDNWLRKNPYIRISNDGVYMRPRITTSEVMFAKPGETIIKLTGVAKVLNKEITKRIREEIQ